MAVSDGTEMMVVKDMGLVTNVFNERNLAGLQGHSGHRPHPLLDHRGVHLAQRPARLPHLLTGARLGQDRWRSPSATTAT